MRARRGCWLWDREKVFVGEMGRSKRVRESSGVGGLAWLKFGDEDVDIEDDARD